jgi:hypothetical protein
MDNADLAALLENNFLAYIRSSSFFFVAGIALFNFTDLGKNFSIIALIIGLLLLFSVVTDYFIERYRIAQLGFYPRPVVDIMAFAIIGVVCLIAWVIYTVWGTEQTSLGSLAKEVESEVEQANQQLIRNVKVIEDKIVSTNKDLIESIRNINNPNYVPKFEKEVPLTSEIHLSDKIPGLALGLAAERQSNTVNDALIATLN